MSTANDEMLMTQIAKTASLTIPSNGTGTVGL